MLYLGYIGYWLHAGADAAASDTFSSMEFSLNIEVGILIIIQRYNIPFQHSNKVH